jgi:hypothetical protein
MRRRLCPPTVPAAEFPAHRRYRSAELLGPAVLIAILVTGCTTVADQIVPTTITKASGLVSGDLERHRLAFLTPLSVTGQEQDRQTLALMFTETLHEQLPNVPVISLSDTLGLINRAGLAGDYRRMLDDYRETGIFTAGTLARLGQVVGARYFAQLKLAGFTQDSFERFSLLGFRLMQTLHANIRLYLQIWDSASGTIAWEGSEELNYSYDSSAERPVTFQTVVREATRQLVAKLP